MDITSNNLVTKLLNHIPDFLDFEKSQRWLVKGKKLIHKLSEKDIMEAEIMSLEWGQIEEERKQPFGLYQSKSWRQFVLCTFFADIISYSNSVDQVSFDRLLFIMHAFPQGFRCWWIKLPNGIYWPVGYTGWYPMLESTFDVFRKYPEKLKDRMVVPNMNVNLDGQNPYLYLFNFSVISEFKKSVLAKSLIKAYVKDILALAPAGLACITVSKDGIRIAERLDMSHVGDLIIDGSVENVYVKRFNR